MLKRKISRATINRLPLYYRTLQTFDNEGIEIVSTKDISESLKIKPEKIRKDLSFFGQFGMKGLGYEVHHLKNKIGNILGLQNNWRLAIIGVGKLGEALAHYEKFSDLGFVVAALFDIEEKIIGEEINGVRIYDFKKFIPISRRKLIDIGVVTVPDTEAQNVADILIQANVKGIWNFTATKLCVPQDFFVVNENIIIGLSELSFYLNQNSR